jgi:hypothetical protein
VLCACHNSNTGAIAGTKALWIANGQNVIEYRPSQFKAGALNVAPHLAINSAVFGSPQGVTFDASGNLWVVDPGAMVNGAPSPSLFESSPAQLAARGDHREDQHDHLELRHPIDRGLARRRQRHLLELTDVREFPQKATASCGDNAVAAPTPRQTADGVGSSRAARCPLALRFPKGSPPPPPARVPEESTVPRWPEAKNLRWTARNGGVLFRPPPLPNFANPSRLSVEAINGNQCLRALQSELAEQLFNTWVRPLRAVEEPDFLKLLAPNRFVVDWVRTNLLPRLATFLGNDGSSDRPRITVEVRSKDQALALRAINWQSPLPCRSPAVHRQSDYGGPHEGGAEGFVGYPRATGDDRDNPEDRGGPLQGAVDCPPADPMTAPTPIPRIMPWASTETRAPSMSPVKCSMRTTKRTAAADP